MKLLSKKNEIGKPKKAAGERRRNKWHRVHKRWECRFHLVPENLTKRTRQCGIWEEATDCKFSTLKLSAYFFR